MLPKNINGYRMKKYKRQLLLLYSGANDFQIEGH